MTPSDPQLYFADDGHPRSERFGDIYYSLQDGLEEARAVFLGGCHMPEVWAGRSHFTVGELGFGTGLNICALMALWAANRPPEGHLHIFSVEGFLMDRAAAARALSAWPEIAPFAEAILSQWPPMRRGVHMMTFPAWGVSLTLGLGEVRDALAQWKGRADAWFLDGFSPALNPSMWAEDVLSAVAEHAAPGARLATFTVAGAVRRGLTEAGFAVEKKPGFGRKRERLEAVLTGTPALGPEVGRMAVIGAGIAGASVIHALRDLGYEADMFDAGGPGAGASGNRAGLVTPRLDAGGGAVSALFADAFYYSTALIRRLCPQAVLSEGVQQRPAIERDTERFAAIAEQNHFASGDFVPSPEGLFMHPALAIDPRQVLTALIGEAVVIREAVSGLTSDANGVHLMTDQNVHFYDRVFVTCGDGVFDLGCAEDLDLRPVRGQIEAVAALERSPQAQAWGGYYVPTPEGFVFGSTHIRGERDTGARPDEREMNLETLRAVLPDEAEIAQAQTTSRAAVRVTTRDHLPVMGALSDRVWALTGLGARGFCLAPWLAQGLVAEALGLPSPLPKVTSQRLDPQRRALRKP